MDTGSLTPEQLFSACARGERSAADEFHNRYHGLIASIALRLGRRWKFPHLTDDLIHQVYVHLWDNRCAALAAFRDHGPGSDAAYLRVLAANALTDACRSIYSRKDQRYDTVSIENAPAVAAAENKAVVHIHLADAERCLRIYLPAAEIERNLQIVKLYFLFDYTAARIAQIACFRLTAAGVDSVIHRCRAAFAKCFQATKGKSAAHPL
jgi:DNA-directed RNA polymerase specialized sigma24 family protein